jgi:transposase-like protein
VPMLVTIRMSLNDGPAASGDYGIGQRRRFTEDFRSSIVEETWVPGTVVADIARQHGLTPQQVSSKTSR